MPKYYAYPARPTEEQFYKAKAAAVSARETFGEFVVKAVEERIAREQAPLGCDTSPCITNTAAAQQ